MAIHRVTAPNAGWSGELGGVQFHNGVALVDDERDPNVLSYCRGAGYDISDAEDTGTPASGAQSTETEGAGPGPDGDAPPAEKPAPPKAAAQKTAPKKTTPAPAPKAASSEGEAK